MGDPHRIHEPAAQLHSFRTYLVLPDQVLELPLDFFLLVGEAPSEPGNDVSSWIHCVPHRRALPGSDGASPYHPLSSLTQTGERRLILDPLHAVSTRPPRLRRSFALASFIIADTNRGTTASSWIHCIPHRRAYRLRRSFPLPSPIVCRHQASTPIRFSSFTRVF
jgi:hypothetical protein